MKVAGLRHQPIEALVKWPPHDLAYHEQDELDEARSDFIMTRVRMKNRELTGQHDRQQERLDEDLLRDAEKVMIRLLGHVESQKDIRAINDAFKRVMETRKKFTHGEDERISRRHFLGGITRLTAILGMGGTMAAMGFVKSCEEDKLKQRDQDKGIGR